MSNELKMDQKQSILALFSRGWSRRRISRELKIHLDTVRKYVSESESNSKPVKVPTGSRSQCRSYHDQIIGLLEQGLSAQRIYDDLCLEHNFQGAYDSVKRYVRKLDNQSPLPFRRLESAPGEEAQIDFGKGAAIVDENGKKRYPHVLRVVLSYSRKGYSEVMWTQETGSFLRGLENAFRHFGGVPKILVPDNLKAAVKIADWFDPELNPKSLDFCRHYGTTLFPSRPRKPHHKGKVESAIKYVKNHALKGRHFSSLAEENTFLFDWEKRVADTRIHGTTKKQVKKAFEEEKPYLQALPDSLFPEFEEGKRRVHRDGYVEVKKAYYSVPPEFTSRFVWVRWDTRLVRIFTTQLQQIAVHTRKESGRFQTNPDHISQEKITDVERGSSWLLNRINRLGFGCRQWAERTLVQRGPQGLRTLQGLLSLTRTYSAKEINRACCQAIIDERYSYRDVKQLIKSNPKQQIFPFLEEHPLIRNLSEYGEIFDQTQTNNKENSP